MKGDMIQVLVKCSNQPPMPCVKGKVSSLKKGVLMALSQEKIGQIAMRYLQKTLEKEGGIRLNPKEIKREIANEAKSLGITVSEAAEFAKIVLKTAYDKTVAELDSVIEKK
jgi:hypothetical protein